MLFIYGINKQDDRTTKRSLINNWPIFFLGGKWGDFVIYSEFVQSIYSRKKGKKCQGNPERKIYRNIRTLLLLPCTFYMRKSYPESQKKIKKGQLWKKARVLFWSIFLLMLLLEWDYDFLFYGAVQNFCRSIKKSLAVFTSRRTHIS